MPSQPLPAALRQLSTRAVMKVLLEHGPTSRAELAKVTGFSKQTMSEVIKALEEHGFVEVEGIESGRVGSPAILYKVAENAGYALGIDAGASTIRAALVGMNSRIVSEITTPSDPRGGEFFIAQLANVRDHLLKEADISASRLRTVSLATPGSVDPGTGSIGLAYAVPEIDKFNVVKALQETFDRPLLIENDINAAAVGERWRGVASGADSVAFLSLGTGVGLGILSNGLLWRGAHGAAGEIAYLPIGTDPASLLCQERGALELSIGAAGISHRYRMAGGSEGTTLKGIFDACEHGDRAALATVEESARIAALAILAIVSMFDPAEVILGGNIGLRSEMSERIVRFLPQFTNRAIPIKVSALGARATMIGALAMGVERMQNDLFDLQSLPSIR